MVLETVAIETFAFAATARMSSNALPFLLRCTDFGIQALTMSSSDNAFHLTLPEK
jgi:hypothetical protein